MQGEAHDNPTANRLSLAVVEPRKLLRLWAVKPPADVTAQMQDDIRGFVAKIDRHVNRLDQQHEQRNED